MNTPTRHPVQQVLVACVSMLVVIASGCATQSGPLTDAATAGSTPGRNTDQLLVVDCLLPGQLRRLGQIMAFVTPQRPIKTSASQCEIRGGEYVAYDRANFATALRIWLPKAKEGDPEAQTYVGEIYEKGLGLEPDLEVAVDWYSKAADQGDSRAQINLGFLYESGLGVERDLTKAMNYYRAASGFSEAKLEYVTSIEAANRKAQKGQIVDLQQQVAQLEASNASLKQKQSALSDQQTEVTRLQREIEQQRQLVLQAAAVSDTQNAANNSSETDAQLAVALNEISNIGQRLDTSEAEQQRLIDKLATQQTQTSMIRQQLTASDSRLSTARKAIVERERRIKLLIPEVFKLDAKIAQSSSEESIAELKKLQAELDQERRLAKNLSNDLDRLKASQSDKSRKIEQQLLSAESNEAQLQRQLDSYSGEITALQNSLSSQEQSYQLQLAGMLEQVQAIEADKGELQAQLASEQQAASNREQADAQNITELEATNTLVESYSRDQQKRIDALQVQLDQANKKRDSEYLSAAQASALAQQSKELEAQLVSANLEQRRLTDRLLDSEIDAKQDRTGAAVKLAQLESQLTQRQLTISTQQNEIGVLQAQVAQRRAQIEQPEIEQILRVVNAGPTIEIIEPPTLITRGKPALSSTPGNPVMNIIGRVDPVNSLLAFQINGTESQVNENGVFKHALSMQAGDALRLIAVNDAGERTEMEFDLLRPSTNADSPEPQARPTTPQAINFGEYHALIIGNNSYQYLQDLRTAENDAVAVEKLLRTKYGFKTELLLNANRYDLLSALNRKRNELSDKDNLLIYYAGHGELSNAKGFWMPVDAEPDNTSNWVSNSSITDLVEAMKAKHIMIIADSCYSGSLTRSSLPRLSTRMSDKQQLDWYKTVSTLKVRTVFTSGGVKPVLDSNGRSRHSLFAEALLDELNKGTGVVQAYNLFLSVQNRVKTEARKLSLDQNPQYSPIRYAGHESGEFLFVVNDNNSNATNSHLSEPTQPSLLAMGQRQ